MKMLFVVELILLGMSRCPYVLSLPGLDMCAGKVTDGTR